MVRILLHSCVTFAMKSRLHWLEDDKMSKSIAEEIMEPLEIVWRELVRLSNESMEIPISQQRVFTLAQEMDAALSFVQRELESFYPDEEPEDCPNCGGKGSVAVPDGEDEIAYEPCPCSDTRLRS